MLAELQSINEILSKTSKIAGGSPAISEISKIASEVLKTSDNTQAYVKLQMAIIDLHKLVDEKFSEKGRRVVSHQALRRLAQLYSVDNGLLESNTYRQRFSGEIELVKGLLELISDIEYDMKAVIDSKTMVLEKISALTEDIISRDGLSDATRQVLSAQMLMFKRSVERAGEIGVAGYRDSIFTIVGRVVLELKSDQRNSAEAVREVIDDVLRVVNVAQAGGSLLMLGAPFIAGLLTKQ